MSPKCVEGLSHAVQRFMEREDLEMTPSKRRGVDEFNVDEITVMPHGDTNVWDEIEGIAELDLNDWGPEEADGLETVDDEIMEFDQEEIQKMHEQAEEEEIARLKAMPALTELQPHEENDYSDISSKMVITWKKREEKGGWFRETCGAPVPVECGCGGFICSHITDGNSPDAATWQHVARRTTACRSSTSRTHS